jgi:hypothetical protein
MKREKRKSIVLSSEHIQKPFTPVTLTIDQVFGQEDLVGMWFSVYNKGDSSNPVPSSFPHWNGTISWLVVDPSHLEYEIVASAEMPNLPSIPVGCGDILYLPPNKLWHVEVSMHVMLCV